MRPVDLAKRVTATGSVIASASAALAVYNALSLPTLSRSTSRRRESIAVCIPARDESARLPLLLTDLAAQVDCPGLRVIVLDDNSVDGTALAARAAVGDDPRFTVVRSETEPPHGWTGKAAACRALADMAFDQPVDLVAFVDADVRLEPGAVAAAAAAVRANDVALLCPWPAQTANTVAERMIQPLLSFAWMSTLPVRVANRQTRASTAVACGQFLMFDASTYRAIGGHGSVARSLTEDLDIARAVRRYGGRSAVVGSAGLVSCRMYEGWPEIRDGYTRWLWTAYGGAAGSAAIASAVTCAYVVPPVAAMVGSGTIRRWGLVGYAAAVVSRLAAGTADRGSQRNTVGAALAHPVSAVAYIGLTAESVYRQRRGRLRWRNRSLPG